MTFIPIAHPGCALNAKSGGAGRGPPRNTLTGKGTGCAGDGDKSSGKNRDSKINQHVGSRRESRGGGTEKRKGAEGTPISPSKTPARRARERDIRGRREENRKMITTGVVV